jgi:hemerythrin-like domain-containing protein
LNEGDVRKINASGRHFIELLRSHIFREENVLFKVAEVVLSPEEKQEIALKLHKLIQNNHSEQP